MVLKKLLFLCRRLSSENILFFYQRKCSRLNFRYRVVCILLILFCLYYFTWLYSESFCETESRRALNINYRLSERSRWLKVIEDYTNSGTWTKTVAYGILIVSDNDTRSKYEQQANALRCYAKRHHYLFHILDPMQYTMCQSIGNFFFQKHCTVLLYLIENPQLKWLLVLDGDNVLVNATKRIEDFIPSNENVSIVHYERFYNGEIMAGNYLIRNRYWSHMYLIRWISFYEILPNVYYHNNDNGALHLHLLLVLNTNLERLHKCYTLWRQSSNETLYDQYVGCTKCALGGKRLFEHVHLLRRGHGFARDYREPENVVLEQDFLLHSFKNDTSIYYSQNITRHSCTDNWEPPVHKHICVYNLMKAKSLIQHHDRLAAIRHPASVGWSDVKNCWPNCESELHGESEQLLLQALCK